MLSNLSNYLQPIDTSLKNSPFFIGILLRILIGFLFISQGESFYNYLNYAQSLYENSFNNPYFKPIDQDIYVLPYPSILLYLISIPIFLSEIFNVNAFNLAAIYFTLVFLFFDVLVLRILSKWVGGQNKQRLLYLYWLSPVLIYLTYITASLDLIALCFFFMSLNYLFSSKLLLSSFALGLALSTKTLIILTIPFVLIYLFSNRASYKSISIYLITTLLTFVFINFQFIFDKSFLTTIFIDSGQNRVLDAHITLGDNSLYLIPALFILIIFKGALIKNFNRDLFMLYLAFAFGIFLIFIKPDLHWYFWLLPHLLYFYAKIGGNSIILFHFLQLIIFAYTGFNTSSLLMSYSLQDLLQNTLYTFLQVILLCNILWVYFRGIQVFQDKKLVSIPFMLGIAGNSGTGKTTLANSLKDIFSQNFTTMVKGDDLHKWERGDENWKNFTHLNPKANLIHEDISTIRNLRRSKDVTRKIYNHKTGSFDENISIKSKNLIIYEGLLPFFLENQRNEYDLKIMILPEEELNTHWKVIRDKIYRNKSKEETLKQIELRKNDFERYIKPQFSHADLILTPFSENKINNLGDENEDIIIGYKLKINLPLSIEEMLEKIANFEGINFENNYLEDGSQELRICGKVTDTELFIFNELNLSYLNDLGISDIKFPNCLYGLIVSIITSILVKSSEN